MATAPAPLPFAAAVADMVGHIIPMLATVYATVDGVRVPGIWGNSYAQAGYSGGVALDASVPTLTIASGRPAGQLVGVEVSVGAVDYIVRAAEPDGIGHTRLLLEQLQASEADA